MEASINFAQDAILSRGGLNHLKVDIFPPEKKR